MMIQQRVMIEHKERLSFDLRIPCEALFGTGTCLIVGASSLPSVLKRKRKYVTVYASISSSTIAVQPE